MKATLGDRVRHIKDAIASTRSLINAFSADEIEHDAIRRAALERFLEIISEASRHIPEDLRAQHPDVPWRRIADLGNRLRHGYDDILFATLMEIATERLDALEETISRILAEEDAADRQ
jgi:uncharacterized protein with HEPN domain